MREVEECPSQATSERGPSGAPFRRRAGDPLARPLSPGEAGVEERIRAILAKPYWDYEEAALVLHVAVKTLRNMKYRREITFTHFGGKPYFPRQTILAELRHNTVHCRIRSREDRRRASA